MDPVVKVALKSISMNPRTGLTHPGDKTLAVWVFRHLKRGGYTFNPDEIGTYLLRQPGWDSRGAEQVKEVAEGVLRGKRFRVGGDSFKPEILDIWRERTREGASRDSNYEDRPRTNLYRSHTSSLEKPEEADQFRS